MRRPPKAFLLLTYAVTALLLVGVITILSNRPGDDSTSVPLPIAEPTPVVAGDETTSIDRRIGALEQRLEELGTQLALQSDETAKRIDEQEVSLRALQEQVNAAPAAERFAALEESISQTRHDLAKRVDGLELSVRQLRAPAKPAAPKSAQPALPFELVSVDTWDGVPYAALSHEGRIELVRQGQSRAGWTVQLIDPSRGLVLFRSPQGRAIEGSVGR